MFTAYELMQRRFGPRIRKFTAGTFLILRALAEGVRVFAISIVISIILGTGEMPSILLIVALTLFYTFEGGMTAVIWTDVVQMFLYMAGAIVSLFVILGEVPGGWERVWAVAAPAGKFTVFDFRFELTPEFFTRTYSFWAGLIGGAFLTTASHGTEQLMVQRLLAARDQRESRLALLSSWVVIFFQFTLFLFIGAILWVYYNVTGLTPPAQSDRIYAQFIWDELPVGVAGLVMAAILAAAMSNLSAALNSLASTTVMDFYRPITSHRRQKSESYYLGLSRFITLVWGVILLAIAFVARHVDSVLEAGLSIASVLYGALLGVFLLGLSTRRVGEVAAIIGMFSGFMVMLYVRMFTGIAWTWYVLIGTSATILAALLASLVFPSSPIEGEPA
jgi:SSS family transporter